MSTELDKTSRRLFYKKAQSGGATLDPLWQDGVFYVELADDGITFDDCCLVDHPCEKHRERIYGHRA